METHHSPTAPFSTFTASPPSPPPNDPPPPLDTHTCRICLEQVPPPYAPDPELGRLVSPCTCKGSSRFVHQGCLQQWRLLSPNQTNFYQCPTCHYQYRFRRLRLAAIIGSPAMRVGITSGILVLAVYLLGFVAEPIINTYLDPPALLLLGRSGGEGAGAGAGAVQRQQLSLTGRAGGAVEHMLKGFASLGLLGFLKVVYLLPNPLWNLRGSGIGSGIGRSGRDRAAQISWVVVAIGVVNFFVFTWGQVGGWVRGWMERAAEEILEVGQEDEGVEGKGGKEE
ncbi:RING finger domain protein [Morchella snyderi]|nr:RING finger domain protein [Morchella snyderi]